MRWKWLFCREQSETLSTNKGRFCYNIQIDTLISKWLSVENKAKLSQLKIVNKQYCGGGVRVSSWENFALFSTDDPFEISVSISILLQNLQLLGFNLTAQSIDQSINQSINPCNINPWVEKLRNIIEYHTLFGMQSTDAVWFSIGSLGSAIIQLPTRLNDAMMWGFEKCCGVKRSISTGEATKTNTTNYDESI